MYDVAVDAQSLVRLDDLQWLTRRDRPACATRTAVGRNLLRTEDCFDWYIERFGKQFCHFVVRFEHFAAALNGPDGSFADVRTLSDLLDAETTRFSNLLKFVQLYAPPFVKCAVLSEHERYSKTNELLCK